MTYEELDPEAIAEKEELFASLIEDNYPELDVSVGSVIRELAIRPAAVLSVYNDMENAKFLKSSSLKGAVTTGEYDAELIDNLASNFRLSRKDGSGGRGSLAIITNSSDNTYISGKTVFTAGSVQLVLNKTYVGVFDTANMINTEELEYRPMSKYDDDRYVFTVPVETLDYFDGAIGSGQPIGSDLNIKNIVEIKVASPIVGGKLPETDESLVNRAWSGVTAKVPSGRNHIQAMLSELFDYNVNSIEVFGMGDLEVLRDRDNLTGVSMGGRVDVYVKTAELINYVTVRKTIKQSDNKWSFVAEASEAPGFYFISEIKHIDTGRVITGPGDIEYTWQYITEDYMPDIREAVYARFSKYQKAVVAFEMEALPSDEEQFEITYAYIPDIAEIQNYLNRPDVSNQAQDALVKAPPPIILSVDTTISYPPGLTDINVDDISLSISKKINELPIGRGYITADDVVAAVKDFDEKLIVEFPVAFEATIYTTTGVKIVRSTNGRLELDMEIDSGVTRRNSCFFCNPADVRLNLIYRETL